jgi:hypothetical protein
LSVKGRIPYNKNNENFKDLDIWVCCYKFEWCERVIKNYCTIAQEQFFLLVDQRNKKKYSVNFIVIETL